MPRNTSPWVRGLLVCGVASSLLYVAIDVLAALRYPAYHSFTEQMISELMARGAPTESLVDPLFLLYGVLAAAFGVGVWMAAGQQRLLRGLGALFVAYALVGATGPVLFEMNVRGTGGVAEDAPHIALTGVLVALIFTMIGIGAFLHGRAFRVYSLATIGLLLATGGVMALDASRLAAGEATPWFGLVERVNIGAFLLWVVVLAISLLRHQESSQPTTPRAVVPPLLHRSA